MRGLFATRELSENLPATPQAARNRLMQLLPDSEIFCLEQVHGNRVVIAEELKAGEIPQADAIISTDPDKLLCVRTADCLPLLAWDDQRSIMAAIHAGWRGVAGEIAAATLNQMRELGADNIRVAIGPAIGPCCFEIGQEGIEAIPGSIYDPNNMHMDLWQTVRGQLTLAGIAEHNIFSYNHCTHCSPEILFSYRRDSANAGRNLTLIGNQSWSLPGLRVA